MNRFEGERKEAMQIEIRKLGIYLFIMRRSFWREIAVRAVLRDQVWCLGQWDPRVPPSSSSLILRIPRFSANLTSDTPLPSLWRQVSPSLHVSAYEWSVQRLLRRREWDKVPPRGKMGPRSAKKVHEWRILVTHGTHTVLLSFVITSLAFSSFFLNKKIQTAKPVMVFALALCHKVRVGAQSEKFRFLNLAFLLLNNKFMIHLLHVHLIISEIAGGIWISALILLLYLLIYITSYSIILRLLRLYP